MICGEDFFNIKEVMWIQHDHTGLSELYIMKPI